MIFEAASTQWLLLPKFEYHLDESDPDIVVLRRQDDSFVAVFSAMGVTTDGIVEAAKADYRELVWTHRAKQGENARNHKSA